MIKLKRLLYLAYYLKQTDWEKYRKFIRHVRKEYGTTAIRLWLEPFGASLKYNISLLEYFYFRFWEKPVAERRKWAGTGFMYEYQLAMNPSPARNILLDKSRFLEFNAPFVSHRWHVVKNGDFDSLRDFLAAESGKIVLKNVAGNCGKGLTVCDTTRMSTDEIIAIAREYNLTLAEAYISQHPDLMKLSPSALNTVRVFTQIVDGKVVILGTRLRISVNSNVDNLAAGNMAAAIDSGTGVITRPAVYSDITKVPEYIHPITGVPIVGFRIPHWDEVLSKVKAIALHNCQNKSVGWDIAITDKGIDFIEGNHDWCKLVYQLPVGTGLKGELEKYISHAPTAQNDQA